MTTVQTWLTVYLILNLAFAVGFILLARFLRRNGKPPDAERATKFSHAVVVGLAFAGLFGVKSNWALVSGEALAISKRNWEWVTSDGDHREFMNTVIFDAGAALVFLVGAVGFLIMKWVARDPGLHPSQKMTVAIWSVMTMFWTFILTLEGVINYRYG